MGTSFYGPNGTAETVKCLLVGGISGIKRVGTGYNWGKLVVAVCKEWREWEQVFKNEDDER